MNANRPTSSPVRQVSFVALCLALAACSERQAQDTKESLARDPERLKVVRAQCHDHPKATDDKLCLAAAEAVRLRFFDRPSVEPKAETSTPPVDPKFASPKF